MLYKNEQNASKTQVANYMKTDSNIVLLLIWDIIIYTDGLCKIRFNILVSSGRLIDQSRSCCRGKTREKWIGVLYQFTIEFKH